MPDYSIGATVLFVAIALPFFVLTRAQHLQRVHPHASASPSVLPSAAAELETPGPVSSPMPSLQPARAVGVLPLTGTTPTARAHATRSGRGGAPAATTPPPPAPTVSSTPPPDLPPVAVIAVTPDSGVAPLAVMADAGGSSDTDQTPIVQVFINFGDGTTILADSQRRASHTYQNPGTYTVTALVIDSARNSSTASSTVLVN